MQDEHVTLMKLWEWDKDVLHNRFWQCAFCVGVLLGRRVPTAAQNWLHTHTHTQRARMKWLASPNTLPARQGQLNYSSLKLLLGWESTIPNIRLWLIILAIVNEAYRYDWSNGYEYNTNFVKTDLSRVCKVIGNLVRFESWLQCCQGSMSTASTRKLWDNWCSGPVELRP